MRIVIVSTYDNAGGASKSSYRLHTALISLGIDSILLVQSKYTNDHSVEELGSKLDKKIATVKPFFDYLPIRFYKNRTDTLFSPSFFSSATLMKKINDLNPDIVHLQWVQGGMLNVKDLSKLSAPLVWGLNDMWAFTGGCHYDEECGGYKSNCGKCKVLGSSSRFDLSSVILSKKKKFYSSLRNLTVVGHSKWLADLASGSAVFSDHNVINLPTPINTEQFAPQSKELSRTLFDLPKKKKLILFGAMGPTSNPRKGFKELSSALEEMETQDTELVIFGSGPPKEPLDSRHNIHYIPRLNDELSLQILYNTADVMVVPSLQENLSNIILESMSCGLPVVAFDIGGNGDMISHKSNGYLAKPFDTDDLLQGINWVLNHSHPETLANKARNIMLERFSYSKVAQQYQKLYDQILLEDSNQLV
ncbi:glycosyltransferase family 4 protein [Pseudomonadota bacterium]|jgi:glycosyltransferase involved in cell wall biosynthesis|nr:glycosyltransferase family 4 protein [Pseudomonadota bacterium]